MHITHKYHIYTQFMGCVYLLSLIHLAYILICHHISGALFSIVRNRLYDECASTTLLRPPCPINIHTVGARERPLNARMAADMAQNPLFNRMGLIINPMRLIN